MVSRGNQARLALLGLLVPPALPALLDQPGLGCRRVGPLVRCL